MTSLFPIPRYPFRVDSQDGGTGREARHSGSCVEMCDESARVGGMLRGCRTASWHTWQTVGHGVCHHHALRVLRSVDDGVAAVRVILRTARQGQ
jgi:hypothetical protein